MQARRRMRWTFLLLAAPILYMGVLQAQEPKPRSSFMPVVPQEDFASVMRRMSAAKAGVMAAQKSLLADRYDLGNRPSGDATMFRGKAMQGGIRAKLPAAVTWESLGTMTPDQIRDRGAWPLGFLPLPHANQPEGGMTFPQFHIDEIKKQEQRDLQRFDLDFDLPDHFLPEFPAPIFLITRTDLGDVSQGKLVTIDNFFEIFDGILNPKQLEGCVSCSRRSPSSSSTRPRTGGRCDPAAAWPAWIAIPTTTRTRRSTSSATSGPRSSGGGSTPRACAG